jgi:hypothetical protein
MALQVGVEDGQQRYLVWSWPRTPPRVRHVGLVDQEGAR